MIIVTCWRLDVFWHFSVYGSIRQFVQRLLNDASGLSKLLKTNQVTIVCIAVLTNRYVEIHVCICGIRARLAYVPRYTRTTKRRTGKTNRYRVFSRNYTYANSSSEPDSIFREQ